VSNPSRIRSSPTSTITTKTVTANLLLSITPFPTKPSRSGCLAETARSAPDGGFPLYSYSVIYLTYALHLCICLYRGRYRGQLSQFFFQKLTLITLSYRLTPTRAHFSKVFRFCLREAHLRTILIPSWITNNRLGRAGKQALCVVSAVSRYQKNQSSTLAS